MVSLPFYPPLDPPLITAPATQTDYQVYYPHKTVWFCQTPQYWGHYAVLGVGDEHYFPLCFTESSKVAVHKQPSAGEKRCPPWTGCPPVCSAHGGWGVWHPDLREGWGRGLPTPLFSGQVETCPEKSCQPSTVLLGWKTDWKYHHCKDTGSQYSTCSVCSRYHTGRIC